MQGTGTLIAEFALGANSDANRWPTLAAISDGTSNNSLNIFQNAGGTTIAADGYVGGVGSGQLTGPSVSVGATTKAALSWSGGTASLCVNGGTVVTDSAWAVSSAMTMMYIGANSGSPTGIRHIRRLKYYPRRLTNAELQSLTT
jgi:hypothetical protein